ncbi:Uncharacterised protein [uncultured archaeon]|nr:Uncharacterised protein [uncultured archaeon]
MPRNDCMRIHQSAQLDALAPDAVAPFWKSPGDNSAFAMPFVVSAAMPIGLWECTGGNNRSHLKTPTIRRTSAKIMIMICTQ